METMKGVIDTSPKRHASVRPARVNRDPAPVGLPVDQALDSQGPLIHELFEARATRTPNEIAIVCDDQALTFQDLNHKANQVARYLRQQGAASDRLVALCVDRGIPMVVSMLAILKAGAAYLPLDPTYPSDRLTFMLEDASPCILLTQTCYRAQLAPSTGHTTVLDLEVVWRATVKYSDKNLPSQPGCLSDRYLAYVIYTSGSTGKPKGAMNEHRGMVNRIIAQSEIEAFSDDDICCQKTSMGFVDAVFEIFGALCNGLRLVIIPAPAIADAEVMAALIAREGVTRLITVPSLARVLLDDAGVMRNLSGLRGWTLSGEPVPPDLLAKLQRKLPNCAFINQYGSSEVSSDVACYRCPAGFAGDRVPIGPPVANVQVHVLDSEGAPVPIGETGEMCVGGIGVGRGYINHPELTSANFIPDPFATDVSARMYRTGDLGRWRTDGTLECLGRRDHQIKIRGFRIEAGEVETRLLSLESIRQAVVVAREDSPGEKRLVAYVTLRDRLGETDGGARLNTEAVRSHLGKSLPEYMVPAAYVVLDSLPLTPNGKVDRRALPAPDRDVLFALPYEAPQGDVERALADIWQKVLPVDRVGRNDNFFALGGHSLLVPKMKECLRRIGFSVSVHNIYTSKTLVDLASTLKREAVEELTVPPNLIAPGCESITPSMLPLLELAPGNIEEIVRWVPGGAENIQDIYPLTPLQEGILFHHLMTHAGGDTYILPTLISFSSKHQVEEFAAALRQVLDRHDILRTAVLWERLPQPVQVVCRKVDLAVEEVPIDPNRDSVTQLRERMIPGSQSIDLRRAPLLRLYTAEDTNGRQWYGLLQIHHLICDNESLEAMLAEVFICLQEKARKLADPVPYRNHVVHALAHASRVDSKLFFRAKLNDIDEPTAPFSILETAEVARRIEIHETLDAALTARIRNCSRRLGVTSATLFHVAWGLVVSRTTGRDEVVYGTVLSGRLQEGAPPQSALGLFINTLPLRLPLNDISLTDLIQLAQRELAELLIHEQVSLSEAQRCSGITGRIPLFTTLLNYRRNVHRARLQDTARQLGIQVLATQSWSNYLLVLSVDDNEEGLDLELVVDERIDAVRIMRYMCTALRSIVDGVERSPAMPALDSAVLPESEVEQLLHTFNPQVVSFHGQLIHEMFEAQVRKSPDSIAVVCEGHSVTYAELNRRANQLGWYLKERGVGPDKLVGVCVERSLQLIVSLLGTLKAGGAYLPLDPAYPIERLGYMLKDANPTVVLIQEQVKNRLPDTGANVIAIDAYWAAISTQPTTNPSPGDLNSHHLAYVIYTSGSTGEPKGVMIEHRNVTRLLTTTENWFEFCARDVWTLFHSYAFDFSVWEIWGALLYGGRLVVVPYLTSRSPGEFYRRLCEQGVTVLNQTPSAFAQLVETEASMPERQHSLRVVIFGGEALGLHKLRPWVKRNGTQSPQLVNMYGITETTVHVTYHLLTADEIETELGHPIGRPIADLRMYLLDRHRQLAPIGVAGEIYVAGAGLARGYLNRPELTRERFQSDPYGSVVGARNYKTGDMGRWRPDGTLEYLGRNDNQVKIRGFRIELGEIEAQLVRHEGVRQAVVIAREDVPGEKRLVAYVVLTSTPRTADSVEMRDLVLPGPAELGAYLRTILPEYMVPTAFVVLERLPLTSNGKLDRAALPPPDQSALPSVRFVAPRSELEKKLSAIWSEVLKTERVGAEDNFFALGGDSILSLRVLARMQAIGLSCAVRDLFRLPTIAQLAAAIEEQAFVRSSSGSAGPFDLVTPSERAQLQSPTIVDAYPLGLLQEGMYFHSELAPESAIYHDIVSTCVEVSFNRQHFEGALNSLIQRHPILRTAFVRSADLRLIQLVHRDVAAVLDVEDISALDPGEQDRHIHDWIDREKHNPFTWCKPPLFRVFVHNRAPNCFNYSLSVHHAILDGWSVATLQTELLNHYTSLLRGEEHVIDEPRAKYRDFIAREQDALRATSTQEFWRGLLQGATLQALTRASHPRGASSGAIETCRVDLALDMSQRLEARAHELGVHLKLLLLAVHVKVMNLISGGQTVVTGVVSHGRLEEEDGDRVLGLHLNTLPWRVDVREGSWRDLVGQLRNLEESILPHRYYPLAAIQKLLQVERLFETLFHFVRFHVYRKLDRTVNARETASFAETNFSLAINFSQDVHTSAIALDLNFSPAVLDRPQVERIARYYQRALLKIVQDIDARHYETSLLDPEEEEELLTRFNAVGSAYPSSRLIHELFEEQVERAPDAIAVLCEGKALTFAQVNRLANKTARYLRSKGAGPDQVVAVYVQRRTETIVVLLGILKAGAAYLPLDPEHPPERVRYMLKEVAPALILTLERLECVQYSSAARCVILDEQRREIETQPDTNLGAGALNLTPRNLAYVIYTSGSTGEPKGVMVEHGNVVSFWRSIDRLYRQPADRWRIAINAQFTFDASVQQWVQLLSGRTLVLIPYGTRMDAQALVHFVSQQRIDGIDCTPLQLKTWIQAGLLDSDGSAPLTVLVGGEAIDPQLWDRLGECDDVTFYNVYGPTECTVDSTAAPLARPSGAPHIGRPLGNTRIYILNAQRQLVPVGAEGEIYVAGAGVARGYLEKSQLTAQGFLPDTFSEDSSARMYKTGDFGCWRADGVVEYRGRHDNQVKIRGYRIELGEIEAKLKQYAPIRDAVVLACEPVPGDKRLVAYVIPDHDRSLGLPLDEEEVRDHLRNTLPDYMLPSAFVILERFPVTSNGKLDRRALPEPKSMLSESGEVSAPTNDLERTLANIWAEILEVERIGVNDNFFALGGHSLSAMTAVAKIGGRLGTKVPLVAIFRHPTVRQLAVAIERQQVDARSDSREMVSGVL